MKNIVIFASGGGTNAENICRYFEKNDHVNVAALFCNVKDAKVIERMRPFNVQVHVFDKKEMNDESVFLPLVKEHRPSLIILAGFLWLMPTYIVKYYHNRIINIHPALLPKFGGKGMYGHHVHEAVITANEPEHGITIHYVNERFDEGEIIFQKLFKVETGDTPSTVAKKIAQLEMKYFPEVIEELLKDQ